MRPKRSTTIWPSLTLAAPIVEPPLLVPAVASAPGEPAGEVAQELDDVYPALHASVISVSATDVVRHVGACFTIINRSCAVIGAAGREW